MTVLIYKSDILTNKNVFCLFVYLISQGHFIMSQIVLTFAIFAVAI